MTDYRAFLRRQLLEEIYDRMSEADRRLFVHMTLQNKSNEEILEALKQQSADLQKLKQGQQTFFADFGSNLLANATWESVIWLGARLFKRL